MLSFVSKYALRRDVARLDGTRDKKHVCCPMFESEVFRKQMYCIEKSPCDIVGTFRPAPQSFGAQIVIRGPGKCAPFPPTRYAPDSVRQFNFIALDVLKNVFPHWLSRNESWLMFTGDRKVMFCLPRLLPANHPYIRLELKYSRFSVPSGKRMIDRNRVTSMLRFTFEHNIFIREVIYSENYLQRNKLVNNLRRALSWTLLQAIIAKPPQWPYIKRISRNNSFAQGN